MTAPKNSKHKPIIAVNDYDLKDGPNAPNSDAKALSIGQAQYEPTEISAKVFRHTGQMWSPQSEELPIHRVFDLAILIAASMQAIPTISSLNEIIVTPERHKEVLDFYKANMHTLKPRIDELKTLLTTL